MRPCGLTPGHNWHPRNDGQLGNPGSSMYSLPGWDLNWNRCTHCEPDLNYTTALPNCLDTLMQYKKNSPCFSLRWIFPCPQTPKSLCWNWWTLTKGMKVKKKAPRSCSFQVACRSPFDFRENNKNNNRFSLGPVPSGALGTSRNNKIFPKVSFFVSSFNPNRIGIWG